MYRIKKKYSENKPQATTGFLFPPSSPAEKQLPDIMVAEQRKKNKTEIETYTERQRDTEAKNDRDI